MQWMEDKLHLYQLYRSRVLSNLRKFVIYLNLVLAAFHAPPGGQYYPYHTLVYVIEVVFSVFFVIDLMFQYVIMGRENFLQNRWCVFHACCVAAFTLLIICFRPWATAAGPKDWTIFLSLAIRPFLSMVYFKSLRNVFPNIFVTMRRLASVLCVLLFFVLMFGLCGFIAFGEVNKQYFGTTVLAMYNLFICMTTVNFPDIMVPGYAHPYLVNTTSVVLRLSNTTTLVHASTNITKAPPDSIYVWFGLTWIEVEQNISPLFFFVFMILTLCFLMTIVFAVIYDYYREKVKQGVIANYAFRQRMLRCAWCSLTSRHQRYVNLQMFQEFFHVYSPRTSALEVRALFGALNLSDTGNLNLQEFRGLYHLLNLQLQMVKDSRPLAAKLPAFIYNTAACQHLVRFGSSRTFQWIVNLVIVFSIGFMGIHYELMRSSKIAPSSALWFRLMVVELSIGLFFDFEILLKVFALGYSRYWTKKWNRFDCFLTLFNLTVYITYLILGSIYGFDRAMFMVMYVHDADYDSPNKTPDLIKLVLFSRMARSVRMLSTFGPFRIVMKTFTNVLPMFGQYIAALMIVFYFFATIGHFVFFGVLDQIPADSAFALSNYYAFNFDTFWASYVTVFCLMVVNNWHIIMEGYRMATSNLAVVYFISFYIVTVVVVMNIIMAFIVEIFLSQWALNQDSKLALGQNKYALRIARGVGAVDNTSMDNLGNTLQGTERDELLAPEWQVSYKTYSYRVQSALEVLHLKESQVLSRETDPDKVEGSKERSKILGKASSFRYSALSSSVLFTGDNKQAGAPISPRVSPRNTGRQKTATKRDRGHSNPRMSRKQAKGSSRRVTSGSDEDTHELEAGPSSNQARKITFGEDEAELLSTESD
eukprot:NODE_157_length_3105_cov_115.241784_g146_i0.p1 GENE.NODE_157_length_3105_cov_115.241784_g146_i0~~NODE_157_length_3105_cov_115.241784_g146_i0.p1  ORF type:complete len:1002 (+),score=144.56 NODE_157_length_3105_cov_115.241784_g146_i0:392-3007(+)